MNTQCCADMQKFLVRNVEIQISNTTQDITLENPRTSFYSGYSSKPPGPSVPPGSSDTFQFSNPPFWGCTGVLVYEATTFTLAIYFSNPLNYSMYSIKFGLWLSQPCTDKDPKKPELTQCDLETINTCMSQDNSPTIPEWQTVSCDIVTLNTFQKPAQVSIGHTKVVATMSNDRRSVIRIVVEEQEASGTEPRRETHSQ
ncbi:hypothetical protein BTVI_01535 [Pitangus sulphuratus]|nr:hypothetical protein BTVI_01535 [Pitangus sulphuratus]